jgi:hypothetical protein
MRLDKFTLSFLRGQPRLSSGFTPLSLVYHFNTLFFFLLSFTVVLISNLFKL